MTLYHYTCDHGRDCIGDEGMLVPTIEQSMTVDPSRLPKWQQTLLGLIWLTDLDVPLREALGLTSYSLGCDRTQHRYRVHNYTAAHWPTVRRDYPKLLRDTLESEPGVMPMHWFIAYTHVPVTYDPIKAAVA